MAKTEFEREKEQYKANLQTLDQLKAKIDAGNQALKKLADGSRSKTGEARFSFRSIEYCEDRIGR